MLIFPLALQSDEKYGIAQYLIEEEKHDQEEEDLTAEEMAEMEQDFCFEHDPPSAPNKRIKLG